MDFTRYRLNRKRLIELREVELESSTRRSWKLNNEFYANKEISQRARDQYKDQLYQDFILMQLYYAKPIIKEGNDFMNWDSSFRGKEINALPDDKEYEKWQNKITNLIRKEVN